MPPYIESIIVNLLSGAATDEEVAELRIWLEQSPDNQIMLNRYRNLDTLLSACQGKGRYQTDKAWLRTKPHLVKKSYSLKWFYRIAAAVIIAFASGMSTMYLIKDRPIADEQVLSSNTHYTEYMVPYGSKSRLMLPDSSVIWMNAGSKLGYHQEFNRSQREIFFEGEGYFHVSKNPDKPFYVRTPSVSLKVLGTSFNLKAYPEETDIETTVESGSVQIIGQIDGKHIQDLVLTANQKAVVPRNISDPPAENTPREESVRPIVVKNIPDTRLYTSWKDNRWRIEKETLGTLSVKLERKYNVRISFTDDLLKRYSFTGILEEETLEQVLEVIKLSAPINYHVKQNVVTLSRNPLFRGQPNNPVN